MQQGTYLGEVQRRPTAEDLSTLKLAMAGKDGVAGTSDDYTLQLSYTGQDPSGGCDIEVEFSSATSFAECDVNASSLSSTHYAISSAVVLLNTTTSWYFSQADDT